MSIIGQQIAESRLRESYVMEASKQDLFACIMGQHEIEDHFYMGGPVKGDFLKNSFPRRCKHCGEILWPKEWEPVGPKKSASMCEHQPTGYYESENSDEKIVNRFPQKCKHCGIDMKPKTWSKWQEPK